MPPEGFFQRWSRLKTDTAVPVPAPPGLPATPLADTVDAAPTAGTAADGSGGQARQLTIDDVARLDAEADYSPFVARGVDQSVRRSALKKMFSDPHFNTGDGLDLYMGDYNKPDPVPAAMLAALQHSKSFFAQAFPSEDDAGAPAAVPAAQQPDPAPAVAHNPAATRGDNEGTAT
jgi:hypothetical protein